MGTALKTLSLRIRGVKTELEDAGLETEGMASTTAQLQEKLKALTHGKVDIMLNADTFKNTTQILREMSEVWEEMTDVEQAAALELIGGKRQANILSSLISNFETVEEVIETSMGSSGSAMAENEKWMDSIAGKSEKLSNNMQTMWNNTINSDAIKFIYEMGIGLTDLIKDIGLIGPALAGVLIYLKAFKNIGPLSIMSDFGAGVKNYAAALNQVKQIKSLNLGMTSTGMLGAESVNAYAAALQGMTAQQQAAILSSAGLEKAHIAQVLAQNGVEEATIRQIVGLNNLNAAKQASVATTGAEVKAALAKQGVTLSEATTTWLAANATKELTKEEVLKAAAMLMSNGATKQEIVALLSLAGASGTATGGIKGVTAALWSMMASNPIGWIMMLISGVAMLTTALKRNKEEAIRAAEETVNAYKEAQKTLKDQKKTIDELSKSYEMLSNGVNVNTNDNINLTTSSYEEYLDICNEIADMFPNLVTGFDEQGNAILSVKGNVDQLTQAYKDSASAARQAAIKGSGDVFNFFKDKYNGEDWNPWGGESYDLKDQLALGQDLLKLLSEGSSQEIEDFFGNLWAQGNYATNGMNDLALMTNLLSSAGIDGSEFGYSTWTQGEFVNGKDAKKQISKLQAYVKSLVGSINEETNKIKTLMDAYLGEDLEYAALSEKARSLISQVVSGLDADFIGSFDSADALYYNIKKNLVGAFSDPKVVNAINDLSDIKLKFSAGEINHGQFTDEIEKIIPKIKNKIDPETLSQIKFAIGIDDQSLQQDILHIMKIADETAVGLSHQLTEEEIKIAGDLEVPEGTILTWEELKTKIEEVKIAATQDFDITNYTDAITNHSAAISEYQEALQSLAKGTFTMDDFMELIKKYPELAKGVDLSSNSFHGLSRNLQGAVKTSTKNFIKNLKEVRVQLIAAGKSTDSIDQLIEAIENMPEDALDGTIQKYSTLADKIDDARRAQDKLLASMDENQNQGYETRGEAMEYMKEAMDKGEIGSESNLWNVAEKYGFTYDSAKTINENADALAKFIAQREEWFKQDDDGNYIYEGTESFVEAVESAVANNEELQKLLTWDYDKSTGTLNFEHDNADWDEIVSILSKTKELAGLTSDEFADMMIQVGQYFGINWGDYDDVLDHLNGIATGTADAKTKVEEYGTAMQNYFGDNSDVDLAARPMVKFDSTNFAEWEAYYQQIIDNQDKYAKDVVDNAKEQLASIQKGDGYATVYSSTFTSDDGTKSVVVTPILPDGSVLSPEELADYAKKLLAGEELEPGIDIKLGEFSGANSQKAADEFAESLHEAQAEYDTLRDTLGINTTIDESGIAALKEIKEIQDAIYLKNDGTAVIDEEAFKLALAEAQYTEDQIDLIIDKIKQLNDEAFNVDQYKIDETLTDKGVAGLESIKEIKDSLTKDETTGLTIFDVDMFTEVLADAEYTEEQIDALIKKIQEYNNIISVSGNTDPLGLNSTSLSIDSLKASLGTLGIAFEDTLGTWFDGKRDLTINVTDLVTTLKAKGWTDTAIKEYVTKLSSSTNIDGFNVKVKGIENIDEVIKTANAVPEEKTTEYEVTGTGEEAAKNINDTWDSITKPKTTDYTVNQKVVTTTDDRSSIPVSQSGTYNDMVAQGYVFDPVTRMWKKANANGTLDMHGSAFAGGSAGAPKTEMSLVGELGPEMLVRNGRWTTVGENGAEFTQVRKGDIIFDHRQTADLLRNGHVTGRGKAYASGTAYVKGGSTFARYGFSGSGGYEKYDVNDTVVDSFGDLSGAADDASDSASEFAETMDWVATRIDEITGDLDLKSAELENAVGSKEQNTIINQMLGLRKVLYDNLTAGASEYYSKAAEALKAVPKEYRDAAQDGSIALTDFKGEVGEEAYDAIEEYREWVEKGDDATKQATETLTEISNLAKTKIDNIATDYENQRSINDSTISNLEAKKDYQEAKSGYASEDIYRSIIKANNENISLMRKQRNEMQKALDAAVASGDIEVGSQAWYDAVKSINNLNDSTIELKTTNEDLTKSMVESRMNKIEEKYDNKVSLKESKKNQLEAQNDYITETTGFESSAIYKSLIDENDRIISLKQGSRDALQATFNSLVKSGQIERGDPEWYEYINKISALDTEIIKLETDNEKFKDSLQDLHWDKFDLLMKKLQQSADDADTLLDILSDKDMVTDDGEWTKEGITAIGLYTQKMENAEVVAQQYEDEIDNLNKNWQRLGYTEEEYLDKLDELQDGQKGAIKSYNDSKKAIVDLNKERIEAIKTGIQEEIDAYDELIQKKKEELDAEKDLYDFQKNIANQQKNIADIERQLAALSGDNSASAVAKRKKLEAELAEAKAELEDSYYERSIENKKNALDNENEQYKELKNSEIDELDEYLDNPEQVVKDSIGAVQSKAKTVMKTINATAKEYGLELSDVLTDPWKDGAEAIQDYSKKFGGGGDSSTTTALETIDSTHDTEMQAQKATGQLAAADVGVNSALYSSEQPIKVGGNVQAVSSAKIYDSVGSDTGKTQKYSSDPQYTVLEFSEDKKWVKVRHHKKTTGSDGWFKLRDVSAYAKGSTGVKSNQLAWIDELGEELQLIPGANGRLEYVKKGTGIIPADLTERLMDLAMNPQDILDRSRPSIAPSKSVVNNTSEIVIDASVSELMHIDHLDGNNPDEVVKIVNKAWEKKMQGLNNAMRKYTRG